MKKRCLAVLCLLNALFGTTVWAQGTAFTYQGHLTRDAVGFNGMAEFQATLWDADSGGAAMATNNPPLAVVPVTNGFFTLPVDFGSAPFSDGASRWLQLSVRTTIGSFTLLSPRQRLAPAPYALSAANVSGLIAASQLVGTLPSGNLNGNYSSAVSFNNAANSFAGNGGSLSNVNAATLNGLTSTAFWRTNGNPGGGGAFLGTLNSHPLDFWVWSSRAMRIEDNGPGPNIIAGNRNNSVSSNLTGVTIAGGGSSDSPNRVFSDYGSVLGGLGNEARGRASVAMGSGSIAATNYSMALGSQNLATNLFSVAIGNDSLAGGLSALAFGSENRAIGMNSVALGYQNVASGSGATALGSGNTASGDRATAFGAGNTASGPLSTALGFVTTASGAYSTAIGRNTIAAGENSFAGGYRARANHPNSFVWSDDSDSAVFASTEQYQFLIRAFNGVGIGTPRPQGSLHVYSVNNPTVMRIQSTGTPGFGRIEFVSNPQGDLNEWRPAYIQSTDIGGFTGGLSFVVNGSGPENKFAEVETMRIQNGRVGIGNNAPSTLLQVGGATCNGATWVNQSDRSAKANFEPIDGQRILEKVAALPIHSWSYTNDIHTRHVGPVAQDFRAAFSVGNDDRSIATVDADGVALAAIQALNAKVEQQAAQLRARDAQIAELAKSVSSLAAIVEKVSRQSGQ